MKMGRSSDAAGRGFADSRRTPSDRTPTPRSAMIPEEIIMILATANVNVATMVVDDINARGGLLGRPVELFVEDSATDDDVARAAAARLAREADVDVVIGGIYSSTRQAIKGPVVDEAGKLYIYP